MRIPESRANLALEEPGSHTNQNDEKRRANERFACYTYPSVGPRFAELAEVDSSIIHARSAEERERERLLARLVPAELCRGGRLGRPSDDM